MINAAGNIPADKEKKMKIFRWNDKDSIRNKGGTNYWWMWKEVSYCLKRQWGWCENNWRGRKSSYVFYPLTLQQRRVICERTSLEMRKRTAQPRKCRGKMLARPPKVRTVKGDGNCFFRAMAVGITGWEVGHLKIRQLVCDNIKSFGPYTRECEGKVYLNQTKMKTSTTYATDVEIMAAAQILWRRLYVYHTYGNGLRWLKFPCKHQVEPPRLMQFIWTTDMETEKTGHFDLSQDCFNFNFSLHLCY